MSTKPTQLTEWATDTVANGANSTNNKVEQTPNHKQFGFTFPEPPGRNHFNYWMNAVHLWKEYTEATLDEIGSNFGVDATVSDFAAKTIAITAGVILQDKTAVRQNYTEVSSQTIIFGGDDTYLVVVDETTGVIGEITWDTDNIFTSNEKLPLYRVVVSGGVITTVVDMRSSVKSTANAGGYLTFDPEGIGRVEGGYTNPNTHPAGTPGFFMGKYSGSGNTSKQGVSAVNSDTDYFHYHEDTLETGPDVDVTINKQIILPPTATHKGIWQPGDTLSSTKTRAAMLARGFLRCDGEPVSRTTYADLFAEIGTQYGEGDGSTTFNLPFEPPTVQPTYSYPNDFAIHGTWPGSISLQGIAINQQNGDIWVCGGVSDDAIFKSEDGGLTYATIGGTVTDPQGVAVNSNNGDVWVTDNNDAVLVLRGGTGTFAVVAADTGNRFGSLEGIAVNNITNDVYFADAGQSKVWALPGGFSSDTFLTEIHDFGAALLQGVAIDQSNGDIYVSTNTVMYVKKRGIETNATQFRQVGNPFPGLSDISFDQHTGRRWGVDSNGVYVAGSGFFDDNLSLIHI
ncbi:MAG: tail fiber protein [Gammaproteobacteria bacterium]|nr:tail fiber protein [Gammaproteobacteria bacterium]